MNSLKEQSSWHEIPNDTIDKWNQLLLDTNASYRQYPYWNEPYRKQHFSPHYLVYGSRDHPEAYACVVSIGVAGIRIGLVQSGPVSLNGSVSVDVDVATGLVKWAKQRGYIFLRFSNSDPELLDAVASATSSVRLDAFPLYQAHRYNLLVRQVDNDDEMLASFQKICRYEIRTAARAGYEIRASDSTEELARVWPIFEATARLKGFRLSSRPLSGWIDLLQRTRAHQLARLYSAYLDGQCIQSIFVIRYGKTAEYMIGALNLETLQGRASPSCLLHWHAMRDFYRNGCDLYNMGGPGSIVYQFKRKFHPVLMVDPEPVTVRIRPSLYRLWSLPLQTFNSSHSLMRRLLYKQARNATGISTVNKLKGKKNEPV